MNIARKYKFWRYPLGCIIYYGIKSYLNKEHNSIKYWINANTYLWDYKIKPYNWGDYINLVLAELISGKKALPYLFTNSESTISMVGSILPWAIDSNTIVWGSGCLNSNDPLWKTVSKPKKILAVRGPLTRKVLLDNGIVQKYMVILLCCSLVIIIQLLRKNTDMALSYMLVLRFLIV